MGATMLRAAQFLPPRLLTGWRRWMAERARPALVRFAVAEGGAVAIEYVLVASLVSIAIIVGVLAFSSQLNVIFNDLPSHF